jgi:hypothetical protein
LLWEGQLPSDFDKIRFGLASVVEAGMTQIVNSVEIKTPDDEIDEDDEDETIDDDEDEPIDDDDEEIDEEDEDETTDDDSDGWQDVDNKTVKYGDLCLTAENPKGSI